MAVFSPAAQQSSKQKFPANSLVILDPAISDLALLRSGILPTATVHILDAQRDGITQITELLQDAAYETIHLVSHGAPGCLYLGNTELSLSTFAQYALQLTTWNLGETDLLLYGCNLAAGDAGEEFLTKLHQLTNATLHAAAQPVGNPERGGTWMLMPQQLHAESSTEKSLPLAFEDFILSRYTGLFTPGRLDTSFGNNGIVTTDFNQQTDTAETILFDSQGRILVAGTAGGLGGTKYFGVTRYSAEGLLDTSFGNQGKVTTTFYGGGDAGRDMLLDGDGRIVLAGQVENPNGSYDFGVVRYSENGLLDTEFGANGKVQLDIAGGNDGARAIALDSSGNILIAGGSDNDSDSDISLVRLRDDGSLDLENFGDGGQVTTDIDGDQDDAYGIVVDSQGRITLASRARTSITNEEGESRRTYNFVLTRYSASGILDTSFGTNGAVVMDLDEGQDYPHGIALDAQGNLLVVGRAGVSGQGQNVTLVRYDSNGALDSSFGDAGKVVLNVSDRTDAGYDILIDEAGKIVVVGAVNRDLALFRFNPDGSRDLSFAVGGQTIVEASEGLSLGLSVALDSADRIVIAGAAQDLQTTGQDFLLARFEVTPAPPQLPVVGVTPAPNGADIQSDSVWQVTFAAPLLPSTVNGQTLKLRGSQSGWLETSVSLNGAVASVELVGNPELLPGEVIELIVTSEVRSVDDVAVAPTTFLFGVEVDAATEGTFTQVQSFGERLNTQEASLFDVDGDGDLDAVLANGDLSSGGGESFTELWLNDGTGQFSLSPFNFLALRNNGQGLTVGDVNEDGLIDVVIANNRDNNELWLNQGDGTFQFSSFGERSDRTQVVRLGDLDGDGDLDIFAAGSERNQVFFNDGAGQFSLAQEVFTGLYTWEARLGDFDGDGDLDVFLAGSVFPGGPSQLWLNNGEGLFYDSGQRLGDSFSLGLDVGDLDGDGDLDAYLVNRLQPAEVWFNDGQGNFTDSGQALSEGEAHGISLGDLDGDGDLDAFVNNYGANEIWLNDGNGQFIAAQQELGFAQGNETALGDLDGDGDLDALVTNTEGPNHVLINDSTSLSLVNQVTLAAIAEDAPPSQGQSIAQLMQPVLASRSPAATLSYIAVVANDTTSEGEWQFSDTNGETWSAVYLRPDEYDAQILQPSTLLRFVPAPDFSGAAPRLRFRALDNSYEGQGYGFVDVSINGPGTGISPELTLTNVEVTPVNDAPRLSTAGVWVSTDNRLEQYSLTGELLSSSVIPEAGDAGEPARDLIVDRLGDIHIYNGTLDPILSTYLQDEQEWYDRDRYGWSTVDNASSGGIATFGNYVFATDMSTAGSGSSKGIVRFSPEGTSRFATNEDVVDLTLGLDDRLYALTTTNEVVVYDPETRLLLERLELTGAQDYRAIAANARGEIFAVAGEGLVYQFGAVGNFLRSGETGATNLIDIDITPSGQLLLGTGAGTVLVGDERLTEFFSFSTGDDAVFVTPAGDSSVLTPVSDHALAPGGAVGSLVSAIVNPIANTAISGNVLDSDSPEIGIALTAVDSANGSWFYSLDAGATWLELPPVTETEAFLLSADEQTRLYFQPTSGFSGELSEALTFRAWDRSSGEAGSLVDASSNGGATAFSAEVGHASLLVEVVNDAPRIQAQSFSIGENALPEALLGVVQATDPETPEALTFEIVEGNEAGWFAIAPDGSLSLTSLAQLDYETEPSFDLSIRVQESEGDQPLSETATVTVELLDQRDTQDFNQDDRPDLLWQNQNNGALAYWSILEINAEPQAIRAGFLDSEPQPGWSVIDTVDFDGDGDSDILLRNYGTFQNKVLLMDGTENVGEVAIGENFVVRNPDWQMKAAGNFDQDEEIEILWRHRRNGGFVIWDLDGQDASSSFIDLTVIGRGTQGALSNLSWEMQAAADFDGDGKDEIVWRNSQTGANALWTLDGKFLQSSVFIPGLTNPDWQVVDAQDFDGDGYTDLAWRRGSTGENALWMLAPEGNSYGVTDSAFIPTLPASNWTIV